MQTKLHATTENKIIIPRDGVTQSPWQSGIQAVAIPAKTEAVADTIYDVLIIGGGITGVTAGLLLQEAGKKCVIAETHTIGFGTTGGTSAHINTFADTTYKEAESGFGKDGAKLFADAINDGFAIIRANIDRYKIQCDYEAKQGYVYAEDDKLADQLNDLYHGAVDVGIKVNYTTDVPTPIAYKTAVVFDGQAQFHPLKYLIALEKNYLDAGGIVLENTRIDSLQMEGDIHVAGAGYTAIKAKHVIYATHIPPGLNIFSMRCAAYRSYVMAVTLTDNNYPDALVYDMEEPYHYFRTHELDGDRCLIAGGNDHKTGQKDPEQAFADLEKYLRKHYKVGAIKYKWSSQYYVPVDGLPYIGQMPGADKGVYCATGYNGNGMMLGNIAAKIICDLILNKESKYAKVFSPSRIKPVAAFKEAIKENADAAYEFVASRFTAHEVDFLKRVKNDTGEIVELEGKKMAVYRDTAGEVHALNPVCTHAKCIVSWNSAEKSWDCPCHGARYSIDGDVLNGPADRCLQKIIIEAGK